MDHKFEDFLDVKKTEISIHTTVFFKQNKSRALKNLRF